MFTLIRALAIIGVIFYFSPARHPGGSDEASGGERTAAAASPSAPAGSATQGSLWGKVVGSLAEGMIRTAVIDKAQEAALRLKDPSSWSVSDAAATPQTADAPRSPDVDATKGINVSQSVRCVYRCDEAAE